MNLIEKLPPKMGGAIAKAALQADIHKPELLLGGGIIFSVGAATLSGWGTLKAKKVLEERANSLDSIKQAEAVDGYSEEEERKDLAITNAKTVVGLTKAYGPAAACLVISCVMLVSARNIEHARLVALQTEYNALLALFNLYRERVREDVGSAKDLEYYNGVEEKEVEEVKTTKSGKEKIVKKSVKQLTWREDALHREYSQNTSTEWVHPDHHPGYNRAFLDGQETWARQRYLSRSPHYLLLSEVVEDLGMELKGNDIMLGWHEDLVNDFGRVDEDISFGIMTPEELQLEHKDGDWAVVPEDVFRLNFNCDGDISGCSFRR